MMMQPPVEDLLDVTGGRFELVVLASRRARQINAYFNQLGEGIGHYVPPQVHTLSHKALTIAFEEIADGKLVVEHSED
jgi:DNA-directed RNA polymerase subunit omega